MLSRNELHSRSTPNAYDDSSWDLKTAERDLKKLIFQGEPVTIRPFDHTTGRHEAESVIVHPAKYLIVDGIVSFHPSLRDLSSVKIFIGATEIRDEQNLRLKVGYHERGYSLKGSVRKSERELRDYRSYLLPMRHLADTWIIVVDEKWHYDIAFDNPFD